MCLKESSCWSVQDTPLPKEQKQRAAVEKDGGREASGSKAVAGCVSVPDSVHGLHTSHQAELPGPWSVLACRPTDLSLPGPRRRADGVSSLL